MRCRECEALLWSYVDGELPDAQRQAVAAHLAGCSRCTLAHQRLRAFPLQPGQLPPVAPPPDFTARLMQRITVLPPPSEILAGRGYPRDSAPGTPFRLVLAFSAAAAALFLGIISTATLALLGGTAGGAPPPAGTANAIGAWLTLQTHLLFSWPVLAALLGMQLVLALLWFRVALPRERQTAGYGMAEGRAAGHRERR